MVFDPIKDVSDFLFSENTIYLIVVVLVIVIGLMGLDIGKVQFKKYRR